MITDKTKLLQDIEAMRVKLASMEQELNKPDVFKHFPSRGDTYYVLCSNGTTLKLINNSGEFLVNVYKTIEEAQKTYNKYVALEKVKRRLLELQGDWKPNFKDTLSKFIIAYNYKTERFEGDLWRSIRYPIIIPYIKNRDICITLIDGMEDELKVIFDIA